MYHTDLLLPLVLLNLYVCMFRLLLFFISNIVHIRLFLFHFRFVVILLCLVAVCQPELKS